LPCQIESRFSKAARLRQRLSLGFAWIFQGSDAGKAADGHGLRDGSSSGLSATFSPLNGEKGLAASFVVPSPRLRGEGYGERQWRGDNPRLRQRAKDASPAREMRFCHRHSRLGSPSKPGAPHEHFSCPPACQADPSSR